MKLLSSLVLLQVAAVLAIPVGKSPLSAQDQERDIKLTQRRQSRHRSKKSHINVVLEEEAK